MNKQLATIHASLDAAIQAILDGQDTEKMFRESGADLETFLREYRTIGFTIPRQMNSVVWAVSKYLDTPNALFFGQRSVKSDVTGDYVFTDKDMENTSTHFEVSMRHYFIDLPIPLIIIHSSHLFFDKIRIRKFYKWISKGKGITKDTLILRVN